MSRIKVWGHRGASGYAPENTLKAFQLAVDMKADGVELDVQMTKDGELVVIHDETIDRVSDGSGWVKDYTLHELKSFNFNNRFSEYKFTAIPTLAEVFELLKGTELLINVELKTGIVFYESIEEKVLKLAESMGLQDRVLYSSFNHYSVIKVKNLNPDAKIGILYTDGFIDIPDYSKRLGAIAIHPPFQNLKYPVLLESSKKLGLNVHVWNIRDDDVRTCSEMGVDAIITNYPDRTKKLIKDCGEYNS